MPDGYENSYQGLPLLDPKLLHKSCLDRNLPTGWLGKANMYRCPLGEKPGTGALLMRGDSVAKLDRSRFGKLLLSDGENIVTFPRIYVTGTECLTPGTTDTASAAFLVEIADFRGVPGIGGPYFAWSYNPGVGRYNRQWPMGDYYDDTAAGSTYSTAPPTGATSWSDMVSTLWTATRNNVSWPNSSPLSASTPYPGLPFVPEGIPHNFDYTFPVAWTPWAALNHALTRLACAVKYDPIADTVTIVRLGAANAAGDAAMTTLVANGRKLWDDFEQDQERAKEYEKLTPLHVSVFFRFQTRGDTFERHLGSATHPSGDELVYLADPDGVTVTTTTNDSRFGASRIYDDSYMPNNAASAIALQFDLNHSTYATDARAIVNPRGLERANDYMRKYRNFNRPVNIVYRGTMKEVAAILGSTVAEVAWYDRGDGAKTEIRSGQDMLLEDWRPTAEALPTPQYWPTQKAANVYGTPREYYISKPEEWQTTTGTAVFGVMFGLPLTFIKLPSRGLYEYEFVVYGDAGPLAGTSSYDLQFCVGLFTNAGVYSALIDGTPPVVCGQYVYRIITTAGGNGTASFVIPQCVVIKGTVAIYDTGKLTIGLLGGRTVFTAGNNRVDYRVIARVKPATTHVFTPP